MSINGRRSPSIGEHARSQMVLKHDNVGSFKIGTGALHMSREPEKTSLEDVCERRSADKAPGALTEGNWRYYNQCFILKRKEN